jgi:hypothetical protein
MKRTFAVLLFLVYLSACGGSIPYQRHSVEGDLRSRLDKKELTLAEIRSHLGTLPDQERLRQIMSLDRGQLVTLWILTEGTEPLALDEFVPAEAKALDPVPFEGLNNQPLYRYFKKVFYRTPDGRIAGYNDSDASWFAGPGYYMLSTDATGVFVDYTQIPAEKPAEWPPIKENTAGLSRFVYGNMHDYLRRVDGLFLIGRAYKHGEETANYFILVR